MLNLVRERTSLWQCDALHFPDELFSFGCQAIGAIGNSITTSQQGKRRTAEWKITVARAVRAARPAKVPRQPERYSITIGISFHLPTHGNRELDIENFMKPTLDAIACGLYCADDLDLASVARWHFDDARFAHLLVHRLPDAESADQEGAAIFISAK